MRAWKHGTVFALLALVSTAAPAADLAVFDSIITARLIRSAFSRRPALKFRSHEKEGTRVYEAEYAFRRSKPGQHYLCLVSVGVAGKFLDWPAHQQRVAETRKQYSDRDEVFFRHEFPAIGRFAQRASPAFGPGGGSYGLSFRTTDDLYDVRLILSSLLPEHVADPGLDLERLATAISTRYDGQSRKHQRKSPETAKPDHSRK